VESIAWTVAEPGLKELPVAARAEAVVPAGKILAAAEAFGVRRSAVRGTPVEEAADGSSPTQTTLTVMFTECIARLNGSVDPPESVNCTDCANFVTTFANLVGHTLHSSRMGWYFDTNPYTAIGRASWTPPGWGWAFSYHEVGWTGSAGDGDKVFDACLKVDGNGDPSTEPRTEMLPVNMVCSDGNQGAPYVYRQSLGAPGSSGYGACLSRPETKKRRTIE
jgi:hypothetical protein